jgi:hypothetical protein
LNGNITASSSSSYGLGSGIGSGRAEVGHSTVWKLTILNGNITASSSNGGAGIGAGNGVIGGSSLVRNLSIHGGMITSKGTFAGIGSGGEGGEVTIMTFSGNPMIICYANLIHFPVNASSIIITNASLIFATPRNRLFGVSPSSSTLFKMMIMYGDVTRQGHEPVSKLNATFLQIENITAPLSKDWLFSVCGAGPEDCYQSRSTNVKSIIVTLPWQGNYSVKMFHETISGFLESEKDVSIFDVGSDHLFVPDAYFVPFGATLSPTSTFTVSLQSRFLSRRLLLLRFGWFVLGTSIRL